MSDRGRSRDTLGGRATVPVFGIHEVCRTCHGSGDAPTRFRGGSQICRGCDGYGFVEIDRARKPPIRVARPSRAKVT